MTKETGETKITVFFLLKTDSILNGTKLICNFIHEINTFYIIMKLLEFIFEFNFHVLTDSIKLLYTQPYGYLY